MKILILPIILIFVLLSSCSYGEFYETKKFDKTYYAIDTNFIQKPKIIKKNDLSYEVSEYYNENEKHPYLIVYKKTSNGDTINISNYYYPNTNIIKVWQKTILNQKIIIDSCKSFYENGKIKREAVLENFNTTYDKIYDLEGNVINKLEKKDFYTEPSIDIKLLASCIIYPENLRKNNCEARLLLDCYVNKKGEVEKIMYDSEHYDGFLQEGIKCILKSKINPAMIDDIPTDFWVIIPISFRLR